MVDQGGDGRTTSRIGQAVAECTTIVRDRSQWRSLTHQVVVGLQQWRRQEKFNSNAIHSADPCYKYLLCLRLMTHCWTVSASLWWTRAKRINARPLPRLVFSYTHSRPWQQLLTSACCFIYNYTYAFKMITTLNLSYSRSYMHYTTLIYQRIQNNNCLRQTRII